MSANAKTAASNAYQAIVSDITDPVVSELKATPLVSAETSPARRNIDPAVSYADMVAGRKPTRGTPPAAATNIVSEKKQEHLMVHAGAFF